MPEFEQFENPSVKKLDDETVSAESAQKKIERIAEEAAAKSTKTAQKYDKEKKIFTI
jgi:hypothetical protein